MILGIHKLYCVRILQSADLVGRAVGVELVLRIDEYDGLEEQLSFTVSRESLTRILLMAMWRS
jgi:hypothetical protein